jgi:hypothetical protein
VIGGKRDGFVVALYREITNDLIGHEDQFVSRLHRQALRMSGARDVAGERVQRRRGLDA